MSNMHRPVVALTLSLLALVAAAPLATAQPAASPPGELSDLWVFWPKEGHVEAFEAAIKTHLAWRKQAGETFVWQGYQPVLGTDMAHYVFRSADHRWADFDAHLAWGTKAKANEAFARDIQPHVARYEHTIAEEDYKHSKWVDGEYNYFWVASHRLKPGADASMGEAIDKIHKGLVTGGWPVSWAVSRTIGGAGGLTIVFPHVSYAAMEEPKPGFMEVLTKGMGGAEAALAALKQFNESRAETNETIYAFRRDLSTPK